MRRLLALVILAAIVVTALFGFALLRTKQYTVRLAVGASGGAFDRAVNDLANDLRTQGIDVELVQVATSTSNASFVNDRDDDVNAAFVAMSVGGREYPNISSVGTIANLPIIVFVAPSQVESITGMRDLKGKRIEVGVAGSMRERTSIMLLGQYGVTEQNSTFLHAPQLEALDNAEHDRVDAVIGTADPYDPSTSAYARQTSLTLIPMPESEAVSGMNGYTSPAVLNAGSFSLEPLIPAIDVPTVTVPATMIVDSDLSEGIVYAIAEYLAHTYGRGTVTNLPGEFPNFSDRQFPPNPSAADFYATGSKPWQYGAFPIYIADLLLPMILALSVFLFVASLYSVVFPDSLSLWTDILQPRRDERALSKLETALAEGRELSVKQRRLLSRVLASQDRERTHRQRAEAMRSQLDQAVTENSGDGGLET